MQALTPLPAELPLVRTDPYLEPFEPVIRGRMALTRNTEQRLTQGQMSLPDFSSGHEYFGLHREADGTWIMREWAPNACSIALIGDFNQWKPATEHYFRKDGATGVWELRLAPDRLKHGDLFKLLVSWPGGSGERIPAYVRRAVQDDTTKIFSAQVWWPAQPYAWKNDHYRRPAEAPRIYEAHVGMAQIEPRLGTYREFEEKILPRIVEAGYNTIQLMAIQEHPYYGSFGYHVSSFFAASSRFGTPEELKSLVDAAHGAGLAVIMDLVHSHSVRNEVEGLSRFDGTPYQYFHEGPRGNHVAWDSRCFNYGKTEVLHFLLSNCRFWLDEYRFDGYRFDGVTSMLYHDHGLGKAFTDYGDYFGGNVDDDAFAYLAMANKVIHEVRPDALTVAEDVSGMPGLGAKPEEGGVGFDYRLAMGTPDYWIKLIKEIPDENWHMGNLYYELTNRRQEEKTISYAESHDQALVGDKTIIFRLIDADMYTAMNVFDSNLRVDRGMALHKMIRLVTLATAGHGYLNFMGNEFGHPEWIDFPRQGNNWSYHYARRQWNLRDDANLRYRYLAEFDKAMMGLCRDYRLIETPGPHFLLEHMSDQVLAFERAGLVFLFNFNPVKSFTDYAIPVPPGSYRLQVDSDSAAFGGFGRITPFQEYFEYNGKISVYLPSRTVLVLAPAKPPRKKDTQKTKKTGPADGRKKRG
ncbi:MAG: alpha amylase C-terminal domain-containing protein [bacterium]